MRAHRLKIWPAQFAAIENGFLRTQLRRADRDYRVGDKLLLTEFDPGADKLTGRYCGVEVTHILTTADHPHGLLDDFVLLSIEVCGDSDMGGLLGQSWCAHVEWVKP
jgi:hypothetical protein